MHRPVRQSHSDTVLSPAPVQMLFEYGWKQIELTESTCPRKVCLQRPSCASHSFAVWSIEQLTTKSPQSW